MAGEASSRHLMARSLGAPTLRQALDEQGVAQDVLGGVRDL